MTYCTQPQTRLPRGAQTRCATLTHRALALAAVFMAGLGCVTLCQAGAIEMGAPFTDGAVLQRETKVPVWGWTDPGSKVTVAFAGQSQTATAGDDGKWMLELAPLKASFEPTVMSVSTKDAKVEVRDILVGEVWLASGQSNMQWEASKCDVGRDLQKGINERVESGKEKPPVIREAKVTDYFAVLHPIEHANVQWSSEAGEMSAIAYAFAYTLFKELDVPIGILNCSFSQTAIQAWTPRVGFRDGEDDYTQSIYQKILETDPATPEFKAAWDKFYKDIEDTLQTNNERVKKGEEPQHISTKTPGNLDGNRDATWLYNARTNPMAPYAIKGCIWNQGYANMGEGIVYYNNLHSMVRGWRLVWDRPELPVYFHQFYCPINPNDNKPSFSSTSEMRLGTWLARDIPHTGMASQIDIGGAIHYSNKTLPGMRLGYQALHNTYADTPLTSNRKGKDVPADGPMFKSYTVEGDKLIVEFDHADGGLIVGNPDPKNMAIATVIPDGEKQVKLFFLADENRVWYPAACKIDGNKVIVTSPKVKAPHGVSYASFGVGFQPNLYNQALLPATPFIYFDSKIVTSKDWPDEALKIDGVAIDPNSIGEAYDYRKMPVLSTQFRDNAVLQADQPVTIWGAAVHPYVLWGNEEKRTEGKAVIHFSFNGIEKDIPVTDDMTEWSVTVPPMKASAEPKTIKVSFTIDGELVHERVCNNVVVGDVWYIAAPPSNLDTLAVENNNPNVRMMLRQAKRSGNRNPSRYSIAVSTTPDNRFASEWKQATGFAAALGQRIAAKTGNPVGIILMDTVGSGNENLGPELKGWIKAEDLNRAPSLMDDYKQLASLRPGNEYYDANVHRYVDAWKTYWSDYIPAIIKTKAVPDHKPWGSYPQLAGSVNTDASETYNVLVESFTPASFKGVVFLVGPDMVKNDRGSLFAEQFNALANSWKERFACEDPLFIYTLPAKSLADKITTPTGIHGKSAAIPIDHWLPSGKKPDPSVEALAQTIFEKAYP
ncbi:MAG: hypothetical protein GC164_04010 [Phycisphaera sp.]|nr:hypothetical protein [Phycisphaera sp.]